MKSPHPPCRCRRLVCDVNNSPQDMLLPLKCEQLSMENIYILEYTKSGPCDMHRLLLLGSKNVRRRRNHRHIIAMLLWIAALVFHIHLRHHIHPIEISGAVVLPINKKGKNETAAADWWDVAMPRGFLLQTERRLNDYENIQIANVMQI